MGSYKKFARFKGGVRKWGADNTFPLIEVLKVCGLSDALWALRCCEPVAERDKLARLFACDCAERVLPLFEKRYPNDKRPRKAIEVARRFVIGEATRGEWSATWSATWSAARSATWSAARSAAWSAARSAEIEWQTNHLQEMLSMCQVCK